MLTTLTTTTISYNIHNSFFNNITSLLINIKPNSPRLAPYTTPSPTSLSLINIPCSFKPILLSYLQLSNRLLLKRQLSEARLLATIVVASGLEGA